MPQWTSGSWRPGGASGAAAVTLLLSGILPLFLSPSASAGAYQVPIINLAIEYDHYLAEFKDDGPAILSIWGVATIANAPVERCGATLWSVLDAGWPHQISPSTAVFTSTTPHQFMVTVVVPPGTPRNLSATLQVYCTYPRAMIASDSAVIAVGPHYGMSVVMKPNFQVSDREHPPRFTAVVTNTGSCVDSYHCELGLSGAELFYLWFHTANRTMLEDVAPQESRTISFIGRINEEAYPDEPGLEVIYYPIYSLNSSVRENVVLTVYLKRSWMSFFDIPTMPVIIWAAAMCAIVVSVIRGRKNKRSLRVPLVKEVGKNGRA